MAGAPRARTLRRDAVRVLRVLGFVAALAIVGVMAVKAVQDMPDRHLRWGLLPPAALATLVWWLGLARGWAVLVSGAWTRGDVATWCRTQALRYLPGGIWAPVSRLAVVKGTSLDRVGIVAAENVIALCAAVAVGGAALAASGDIVFAPLVLALAVPPLLSRLSGGRTRVEADRALAATLNYMAAFAAYAVAAVLVQGAVSGLRDPLAVAGAAALAWGAGLVVIFAPSGIGVREVAYVGLLAHAFPDADLVAAAVTLRLVTIAAELATLVVAGRSSK